MRQRPVPGWGRTSRLCEHHRHGLSHHQKPRRPPSAASGGAGWDAEPVRGGLPGQSGVLQGFLDVHVVAVKVHQDDIEVGVLRGPVEAGHVRDELLDPAGLVLHCQTQPQTSLRLTAGAPRAPPSPTKPTPLLMGSDNLSIS